jgi:hypothetical protein
MKKFTVALLVALFVAGSAFFAYAVHQDIAIPYEYAIFGHKATMPMADDGDLRHHIISHML